MRIKKGYNLRKIAGEYIIVKPELGVQDLTNVYTLNSTSAFLFEEVLGREFSVSDLVELLKNKYGINDDLAQSDSDKFISLFRSENIIEE